MVQEQNHKYTKREQSGGGENAKANRVKCYQWWIGMRGTQDFFVLFFATVLKFEIISE